MTPGLLPEATVFAGRYRVVRCIAVGGMGAVYEVIHVETERRRALKVMHPQFIQNDDMRSRFRQEARVAAKVDSVHIVDVFDAGIDEATGMPFLVMELLHGEELGQRLKRVKRFAPADVVLYLHQAALALDKTHRAQIVHRDLKPDNLFLCERDDGPPCIKVLDFGIAKLVAEGSTQGNATRSLGTPLYMAPEQFRPPTLVAPATDIFALGMIAYTLLVGAAYWLEDSIASGNVFAFATAAGGGPREAASARALRRGVVLPPAFDVWFARATALSPADRFPTASAAAHALAHAFGLPRPGQEPQAPVAMDTGAFAVSHAPAPTMAPTGSDTTELPLFGVPIAPVVATAAPFAAHAPAMPAVRPFASAASTTPGPASPAQRSYRSAGPTLRLDSAPAAPASSPSGSGTDLMVPAARATAPSNSGPLQATAPGLSMPPGAALTALSVAGRRRSQAAALVAGVVAVTGTLIVGGAIGAYVIFVKPRAMVTSSEPAASPLPTAEPVAFEPTAMPAAAPAVEIAPSAGAMPVIEPPDIPVPSSAAPAPVAAVPSAATPPSPTAPQASTRPARTPPPPSAKKSGIYRRD